MSIKKSIYLNVAKIFGLPRAQMVKNHLWWETCLLIAWARRSYGGGATTPVFLPVNLYREVVGG